jgi:hypothetical protein
MKFLSRLACLGLLSLFGLTRAEAQNSFDCGNLNQRACQHSDWARMNLATGEDRACEVDLRESGGFCVNDRRNLAGVRRLQWAAWALEQQLLGIGNDTPVNFLSWPAAQGSYANAGQGYPVSQAQQTLSVTDQLNAGARLVVFDLRHFAGGGSGEALRLCRAETGTECGLPDGRFRLFGYALQEVANWVDANPGQVVLVRLNNFQLPGSQMAAVYEEVQRTLGARLYPNQGMPLRWPTPGEMRAAGKPVLVAQFNGPPVTGSAVVWNAAKPGQVSDRVNDQNLVGCVASDGMELAQRGSMQPLSWWDVAESTAGGVLDAVGVRNAVRCGVASLGMTQVSAADVRLPAMVWSWAEGDWGRNGAAMLNRDGRWSSGPETQALPVACALRREVGSTRQDRAWRVTQGTTAWSPAAGEALCVSEFGTGYTFAAPENAYQNHALATVAAARQVWLRHKAAEMPSLSLSTRKIVFQMRPGGSAPAAQTLLMGGAAGTPVRIRVMPGLPLTVSANAGTLSPTGLPLEVGLGSGLGSGLWMLPPGVHRGGVELTVRGQTTVVEVELTMRAAPTLSAVAEPATAEPEEAVSLRLQLMNTFQPQGEYSISRVTNGVTEFLTKGVMTSSFGSMAQARVTLPNLPLGTHTLLAMVAGDARNLPASARPVTVTIRKRLAANPAAVEWQMLPGGALPTRDVAVTGLGLRPVALTGCNWMNAIMVGSTLRVTGREAVRQLPLGTHRCEVIVGDELTMQGGLGQLVVPVTLLSQATLTAQPGGEILLVGDESVASSLNLATSAASGLDLSVTVSAPWLQVTPLSGARAPGAFRITAVGGALPYGRHRGEVVFRSAVTPELRVPIVFDRVKPTIIETNPANMPFKVDGTTYTGGAVFNWPIGSMHQLEMLEQRGDSVRQIPSGWTIQGSARTGASTTVEATAQGGVLLAIYTGWFRLQLLPDSNGTIGVTSSVPPNGEFYPHGARVELVGQPKIGFGNMTWSVDSGFGQVTSNEQKIPLTIFSPTIARVQFHPQEVRRVEITANVPGVSATVDGVVTSLPAYFNWYPRSEHTIVVTQTMPINEQSRRGFMTWENGNTSFSRQIFMPDSPLRIQATYGMEHLVTVTPSPAVGGSVQGAGWYREGAPIILRAIPASGYVFAGYSGNVTSTQALTPVTVTGPLNVVAHFTLGTIAGHAAAGGGQRHPDAPVLWRRRWMV